MKKVLDVKTWKDSKGPQFRIPFVGVIKISHRAIRINDNQLFSSDGSALSRIFFEKRIGNIYQFMGDCVHVLVEVKKLGVIDFDGMEFDLDNYDVFEVPINDIEPRYFKSINV